MRYVTYKEGKVYHLYDEVEQKGKNYKRTVCSLLAMKDKDQFHNSKLRLPKYSIDIPQGRTLCKVCATKQKETK